AGAFYYAENGENSMHEVNSAISRVLGFGGRTEPMSIAEAAAEWGEGAANYSFGSNSRVRATRARRELGWSPSRGTLLDDIDRQTYPQSCQRWTRSTKRSSPISPHSLVSSGRKAPRQRKSSMFSARG